MKLIAGACLIFLGVAYAVSSESNESIEANRFSSNETSSGDNAGRSAGRVHMVSCQCGWANKGRIVGGQETKKNEYPMIVALKNLKTQSFFCGGTIITPHHVLTAGHCTKLPASDISILVGAHYVKDAKNKEIRISKAIRHENYLNDNRKGVVLNDIAVLVTSSKIDFNQNVGPACWPTAPINVEGQEIKALGWGTTQYMGRPSDFLREADLTVIPFSKCQEKYRGLPSNPRQHTCVFNKGKSVCHGDSGGPQLWQDPETNRYTIVSLTSFGLVCGQDIAVMADVTVLAPWVNKQIAANGGDQTCRKI